MFGLIWNDSPDEHWEHGSTCLYLLVFMYFLWTCCKSDAGENSLLCEYPNMTKKLNIFFACLPVLKGAGCFVFGGGFWGGVLGILFFICLFVFVFCCWFFVFDVFLILLSCRDICSFQYIFNSNNSNNGYLTSLTENEKKQLND